MYVMILSIYGDSSASNAKFKSKFALHAGMSTYKKCLKAETTREKFLYRFPPKRQTCHFIRVTSFEL